MKLLMEYESVTQKVLFDYAVLVPPFFETKSVIKTHRHYRTQYGKDSTSDNAIRRWLKQFQETGNVLDRKGTVRPSISQEGVDRIQEASSRKPTKIK
jgi:hypothetical protein